MRSEVVEDAAAQGVKLIVSVDTGIRANEVVRHAAGLGIDVIVTDHHLPEAELPPALAVLNPNRPRLRVSGEEPVRRGRGVEAGRGADARRMGTDAASACIDSLLKLVAIATVADVVPLTGENRVIVKRGLEGLREVTNPGLRALLDVSGSGRRRVAQRPASGVSGRAAHQRRRTHGQRQRRDRTVLSPTTRRAHAPSPRSFTS